MMEARREFHRPALAADILLELNRCESLISDANFSKLLERWVDLDETLGRQVAVKRILEHLCMFPEFVDMFTDEARIAAGLQHPNIVPVLDLGVEDGAHYMVLEYVAGASLKEVGDAAKAHGQRVSPPLCFHLVHL